MLARTTLSRMNHSLPNRPSSLGTEDVDLLNPSDACVFDFFPSKSFCLVALEMSEKVDRLKALYDGAGGRE